MIKGHCVFLYTNTMVWMTPLKSLSVKPRKNHAIMGKKKDSIREQTLK